MNSAALFGLFPDIRAGRYGGVELSGRLAWAAARNLARSRGVSSALFSYHAQNDPTDNPVQVAQIVAHTKTQAIWRALRANVKPRVIFVWHLQLLKLVPLLRAPNARVVVFLHGIEAWRAHDALTRRVLPRVNLFLSNSDFTYERFLQFNPSSSATAHRTVPLGAGAPEPFVESAPRPIVLMVSRLERGEDYKGHRELINAWGRVRTEIPGAELWIVGDGNLRADLEALAQENHVHKSVRFLGQVSEEQKQEYFCMCRVFAMPSRGEGFGLAYVEAMRAARPCLVSDCDGGRAVVNPPEAGLAANPGDAEQLTRALVRLLTPGTEWKQWSRAAHARYAQHFTAEQFQKRLGATLGEML